MLTRYRAGLAVTSLLVLIAATPSRSVPQNTAPVTHSDLAVYSKRALRRARIILQLELLQLRAQRLEAIAQAVQRALRASPAPTALRTERRTISLP